MADRQRITFRVSINSVPPKFLTRDPGETWSDKPEDAHAFTMHVTPTFSERLRVNQKLTDLHGGASRRNADEAELAYARSEVQREVYEVLWPDGRPEVTTPEEQLAQEDAFEAAWAKHSSEAMGVLGRKSRVTDAVRLAAEWSTLIVSPPPGWEDIADKELSDTAIQAILDAVLTARGAVLRGNVHASA